ncbi:radical SAM protein [candidate division KSB1 bacterium]|nr:radical SAM protein [candidate division KSB1 bacterium]
MKIREIEAKSILRKYRKIDSWFLSGYGMNLYRGCTHNCVYCDGRAEGYYVEGEFGHDVTVKINAIDILKRELDPNRKRVPLKSCFILLGGGVGDSYQPTEKKYLLSRKTLELLNNFNLPVHVLTKSTLIERDMDILKSINDKNRVIISFSFSSADDKTSVLFEPGVPVPTKRLETLVKFKKQGFACGMFLMPVIPYVTDKPEIIEQAVKAAVEAGIDFIIFGGMTLKQGRQKDYFMNVLRGNYPQLAAGYDHIYTENQWGEASREYYHSINQTFFTITQAYGIPVRIPQKLYNDMLNENDRIIVLLEHIDYLLKMKGEKSYYGYAAYSVSKVREPLSTIREKLDTLKGVGPGIKKVILEILDTGRSAYFEKLSACKN